jgi:hypothetical protein
VQHQRLLVVREGLPARQIERISIKPAPQKLKLFLALGMLAASFFFFHRFAAERSSPSERAYFYDESERKLFAAPRTMLAPFPGLKTGSTAVRAIVISTNGNPADKSARRIAYLEKYTPELKAALEAARAGRGGPAPPREILFGSTLVRRPDEADWRPISSREGKAILNEWQTPGPDGKLPTVCSP